MYRLLIVDDEYHIVDWLTELFLEQKKVELEIYRAYLAREALDILDQVKIDVVLSDIRMPGIDGFELADRIRDNWPEARIIFLTGYNDFDYAYRANQYQNIRYLLGQLKTIHLPDVKAITLQEGFFRYDNHVWTKDFNSLFQLYALALGCVYFRGFGQTKDGNITSLIDYNRCTPTLSPKDPAFPAWWEAHRAEWEA